MMTFVARASLLTLGLATACSARIALRASAPTPDRAALLARIDSIAEDALLTIPASSAAVAVVRGTDTLVMRGYGLADREAGRRASASTVYQIGSITKQATAASIMRLVERGLVRLDDDVSKYLPSYPMRGRRVSVRQLLNHTSGLPNMTSSPGWRPLWDQEPTPDSLINLVARDSFTFEPGTHYVYSNTNYIMLGMIIERMSGKSYADFVADEFFKPLGLARTGACPGRVRDTTFAVGYGFVNGAYHRSRFVSTQSLFSTGGLCSTAQEYVVWQRALLGGKVLGPRSLELMTTPDTLVNGMPIKVGFGFFTEQMGTRPMILHTGSMDGFTTSGIYFPAETLSVNVFTNTDVRGPEATGMNIARAVLGIPLVPRSPRLPAVAMTPADRDALLGTYDLVCPDGRLLPLRVYLAGDTLMAAAQGLGPGAMPLLHIGNQRFRATIDPTHSFAFSTENGVVSRVRWVQGSTSMEGRRRP
jgi:CubicO group peptidase (beta-lactamase class C family)